MYISYRRGALSYEPETGTLRAMWNGRGAFLPDGSMRFLSGKSPRQDHSPMEAWGPYETRCEALPRGQRLTVRHTGENGGPAAPCLCLSIEEDRMHIAWEGSDQRSLCVEGSLEWGAPAGVSAFAVDLFRREGALRMASGPAVSHNDRALFDRSADAALELGGPADVGLRYDWETGRHRFRALLLRGERLTFRIHEHYMARKFCVPYRPVARDGSGFRTPPAGWMTWYAVKFDASEETVLRNARWQAEHLAPYGARHLWVDWEWYHSKLDPKVPEHPDISVFQPDPRRYPRGMKALAQDLRALGLVPGLWVGPTVDPNRHRFFEQYPDAILADEPQWCGRWWLDPSHPAAASTLVPDVFRQALEWGYEAFKWDVIPGTLQKADHYHDRFFDPSLTSDAALRGLVAAAREVIGPSRYMMSCAGAHYRDITLAIDLFDGGRIGNDIFAWDDFLKEAVARACTYLCFHNILFFADLDNVVLREEFNTFDQAVSRVSFTGLTGTPVTFGDDLPALPPDRVDLLRRILPVIDTHPMDLEEHAPPEEIVVMNLVVARPFEQWNVVNLFNTTAQARRKKLDFAADLHLPAGGDESYLAYDYWNSRYLGCHRGGLEQDLPPFASRVLAIRKKLNRPQVLSTSRHISQGGADLVSVSWKRDRALLQGVSRVVRDDPYRLTLHIPDGWRAVHTAADAPAQTEDQRDGQLVVTIHPACSGSVSWSVGFEPVA